MSLLTTIENDVQKGLSQFLKPATAGLVAIAQTVGPMATGTPLEKAFNLITSLTTVAETIPSGNVAQYAQLAAVVENLAVSIFGVVEGALHPTVAAIQSTAASTAPATPPAITAPATPAATPAPTPAPAVKVNPNPVATPANVATAHTATATPKKMNVIESTFDALFKHKDLTKNG